MTPNLNQMCRSESANAVVGANDTSTRMSHIINSQQKFSSPGTIMDRKEEKSPSTPFIYPVGPQIDHSRSQSQTSARLVSLKNERYHHKIVKLLNSNDKKESDDGASVEKLDQFEKSWNRFKTKSRDRSARSSPSRSIHRRHAQIHSESDTDNDSILFQEPRSNSLLARVFSENHASNALTIAQLTKSSTKISPRFQFVNSLDRIEESPREQMLVSPKDQKRKVAPKQRKMPKQGILKAKLTRGRLTYTKKKAFEQVQKQTLPQQNLITKTKELKAVKVQEKANISTERSRTSVESGYFDENTANFSEKQFSHTPNAEQLSNSTKNFISAINWNGVAKEGP